MYKAIVDFKDLRTGCIYKAGDTYPKSGSVDKDRAKQLMTPTSQRGALIEEVIVKEPVRKKSGRPRKSEVRKED